MHTIIALAFCLLLGVTIKAYGIASLLWYPLGFGIALFITAQIVLPLLLGLPRAIRLVARRKLRAAIFGQILLTPVIWSVLLCVGLIAIGYLWPSVADSAYNNAALNIGLWVGTIAIVLSPLSAKSRADFRADFDSSYREFYIAPEASAEKNRNGNEAA
ncbi:MAG TPA: hypothetical protein VFD66_00165 [Verrucomicrobiae bacterium]|nr:hypothetical protein [Verrucomicrobiae bacterium]